MDSKPRLRMFAGPNGSGKSTIKEVLPPELLGVYINPDEIEKRLREDGGLPLADFAVTTSLEELQAFFRSARLLQRADLAGIVGQMSLADGVLCFGAAPINSYIASVTADFLRHQLLASQTSFTFETVMSSADKVEFLCKAHAQGFRTYLYFVATEDPEINISRVAARVQAGGHNVPEDKIRSRYTRSLGLLLQAIRCTDRAYIFDNSMDQRLWIAEVTDGRDVEVKTGQLPVWFVDALQPPIDEPMT